ncbi:hypothetical protein K491DRAFT_111291 [Lophiostoma macrostomum CBS 122681]|uniref:Uncharacterized protein n=1 Tax=Lophiostoma macrostomum CBS 122681 TaxID=1314788 RepID=A0A6A6STS9_9PLEO|nr:hypothetical protein K491DRAFT_111291 [Lophiostoma macrostomum CBS 122681]
MRASQPFLTMSFDVRNEDTQISCDADRGMVRLYVPSRLLKLRLRVLLHLRRSRALTPALCLPGRWQRVRRMERGLGVGGAGLGVSDGRRDGWRVVMFDQTETIPMMMSVFSCTCW